MRAAVESSDGQATQKGTADMTTSPPTGLDMAPGDRLGHALPDCRVVRAGAPFTGKQALSYQPGISAESVGARGIHMQLLTLPPGARAKAHKHEGHETAIYVLEGTSGMWYGERLERHVVAGAGDFVYIPANVPHLPYNPSASQPCLAVISRTDPNEQESVVLLPELDLIHA
jgi:uncharacterized RmlC-like cupin family protein